MPLPGGYLLDTNKSSEGAVGASINSTIRLIGGTGAAKFRHHERSV